MRHVALPFDPAQWSAEFKGAGAADSMQIMIMRRELGVAIGVTEFQSFRPLRQQAVVSAQLSKGLNTQFARVAPAGADLPARELAVPEDWTCDHHLVGQDDSEESRGYTSCVYSTPTWFANLVVITSEDASEAEIEAANAVLKGLRPN
ncbi:hypothetical protein [Lysobacter silvisoli]|uniref:Uncharacterized protein n=1 Tax=Lysobacter silvisoli TaxID=2293254 RepID=A0A371JWX7_9GAMM|nr:hypothetical protein [Lysobacter silvisoli]RDZ26169.1 hypothetical protein DX914_18015 [Lysobacter silvisoli]